MVAMLDIKNLSKSCRHEYDQSFSWILELYFWRDFAIWHNCGTEERQQSRVKYRTLGWFLVQHEASSSWLPRYIVATVSYKVSILGVESLMMVHGFSRVRCKKEPILHNLGINMILSKLKTLHLNSLNLLNKSSIDLNIKSEIHVIFHFNEFYEYYLNLKFKWLFWSFLYLEKIFILRWKKNPYLTENQCNHIPKCPNF